MDNQGKKSINEEDINKSVKRKRTKFDIDNILNLFALLSKAEYLEPKNYEDIQNKPDKIEWEMAVHSEFQNMKNLKVFTECERIPKGATLIKPLWIFVYKYDDLGNIVKRKARIVARGCTQVQGKDFLNNFSPTLHQDVLRIVCAIAAHFGYEVYQIDIKAAYLNADLEEEIYLECPKGYENKKCKYWKLHKALYGLKQAGHAWNKKLNDVLKKLNFKRLYSEPCLYIKQDKKGNVTCLLTVYVDDILITGKNNEILLTKKLLKENFEITDIGPANFIIGIKIEKLNDGYLIHQKRYVEDILRKFDINKYKTSTNTIPIEDENMRNKKFDRTTYQKAVGSLLYLAISTRPDILFSVSKASRKNTNPTYEDWINVIKIFRYIKGTTNYGIKFDKNIEVNAYADADFAGDNETKKSTTGFLLTLGNSPTTWYSKLQHCISVSTAESEYYSINECANVCLWYINLLNELKLNINTITINVDNKAAIYNSKNNTINPKSRHINIKYHRIRELVQNKSIDLQYIKSQDNLADGFTKYLPKNLMTKFRNSLLTEF